MSFGDHLEELRGCLIRAIVGLVIATIFCFHFGDRIIEILATPYCVAMEQLGFDPRLVQLNPMESFLEYFKIAVKFGLVLATPWILYQLWKFVESGLYPSERRIIRYFSPASIFLFLAGACFTILVVLSGLLKFLIMISTWFPLPSHDNFLYRLYGPGSNRAVTASQPAAPPTIVPILAPDPQSPAEGQTWFNPQTQRLKLHHNGETYSLPLHKSGSREFVQPFFSISEYLGFVVNLALAFGLGFQIPILVVFLVAVRIISTAALAGVRKYVILGIAVLAAVLTPSPDAATMLLLAVPMMLLFEAGLLFGRLVEKDRRAEKD
jgi:Sec-independent protein secretion pathway component TatC